MNQHPAPADEFLARAVAMLSRIIGAGTPSRRAIPAVAAEMGVSEDDLREAYRSALAHAGDAVAA